VSPTAPANSAELLSLDSGGQAVRDRLVSGIPLQEIWLADGPDRLMVCRYEAGQGVCPLAISVEFNRTSKGWSAGSALSRLCVD
jgi:hypothetical protein